MSIDGDASSTPYDEFCRALRSRGPTLNLLFEQARVSPEREGDTIVRDAFACAILTVLHDMLREYWSALGGKKSEWKRLVPSNLEIPKKRKKAWTTLEGLSNGTGYGSIEAFVRDFAAQLQNRRAG